MGKCDKKLNNLCGRAGLVYIWQGHREEECFEDCQQSKPGGQSSSLLNGSELEPALEMALLLPELESVRPEREERLNFFGKQP